jgi:hypothetical protein
MVSPTQSKPSCRSVSPCTRPRYRTDRSRWGPHRQQRRSLPVPASQAAWPSSALPPVQARAQAWPLPLPIPWRPSEQRSVLVRGMPPRTTPRSQPEMSVFATRTTGSLIIVTGRWPEGASRRRGMDSREMLFWEGGYSVAHRRSRVFVTGPFKESKRGHRFQPFGRRSRCFCHCVSVHCSRSSAPELRKCAPPSCTTISPLI